MKIVLVHNDIINELEISETSTGAEIRPIVAALLNLPLEHMILIARGFVIIEETVISNRASDGDCILVLDARNHSSEGHSFTIRQHLKDVKAQAASLTEAIKETDPEKAARIERMSESFKKIKVRGKKKDVIPPKSEPWSVKYQNQLDIIDNDTNGEFKKLTEDLLKRELPPGLRVLLSEHPDLAIAVRDKDPEAITEILKDRWRNELGRQKDKYDRYQEVIQNPDTAAAQQILLDEAKRQNASKLWKEAAVILPTLINFTSMLYLPCKINEIETWMLVDTGAQSTMMSLNMAKILGIDHLIDMSHVLILQGVGHQRSYGTIPLLSIDIGEQVIRTTVGILEELGPGILLGLDCLRHNGAKIDVVERTINLNDEIVPFFTDDELITHGINTEDEIVAYKKRMEAYYKGIEEIQLSEAQEDELVKNERIQMVAEASGANAEEAAKMIEHCDGDTALAIAMLKSMQLDS